MSPLTDSIVDYNHSVSRFCGSNSTITVPEQSDPMCQRNATFALSDWYDLIFLPAILLLFTDT
jgi:hypothetical protein